MKVAFVSGNREKLPDAVIPLGLLYVMASTPDRHEMSLLDLCFEEHPEDALATHLGIQEPDVVALGMRNIQSADYTGVRDCLAYYRDLIATIRASTRAPLVIGGSGFSVMPRELMEHLRPDYGISGEGERAFPDLLHAIESDGGFERIGNLHWFRDGSLLSNLPPRAFLDLDAVPAPDRSLVEDRYYQDYGIESVQTKRGCPLRCDYCTYPVIEGRVGRVRDPGHVVDELVALREGRPLTRHVFIVDSVFNLPRSHAKAVCRAMIERSVDLPWTCSTNHELQAEVARGRCRQDLPRAGRSGRSRGGWRGAARRPPRPDRPRR